MRLLDSLLLPMLLAFSVLPALADSASTTSPVAASPTAAETLDNTFRQIYAQARQQWREKESPVIISMFGNLILIRDGKHEQHSVLSPQWQILKTVDHIPLAIFVALESHTDRPIDQATRDSLNNLREKVAAAAPEIAATTFSAETAARQKQIQNDSMAFVAQVLNAGSVTRPQLDEFAGRMGKLVLANADDAEDMEMGEVDKLVRGWKEQMSPEEWRNLHVIVCDAHMPRDEEREMLYFQALLAETKEGRRIVFAENGDDEDKVLNLLATHGLDEQVALSFFRDPWRMHRDLLGDGAKRWLRTHELPR